MPIRTITVRCVEQILRSHTFTVAELGPLEPSDYEKLIQHAQEEGIEWHEETLGLCNFEVLDADSEQLLYKAEEDPHAVQDQHDS